MDTDVREIKIGSVVRYGGPAILTNEEGAPHALGQVDRAEYVVGLIEEMTAGEMVQRLDRSGIEEYSAEIPAPEGDEALWFHLRPKDDEAPLFVLTDRHLESPDAELVAAGMGHAEGAH